MNRIILVLGVVGWLSACGQSDEAAPNSSTQAQSAVDQAVAEAEEIVNEVLQGGQLGAADEGTEACAYFESGLIPEMFAVDAEKVSYRRSIPVKRVGHVVCGASWDKPNKAELDAGYQAAIQEWTKSLTSGGGRKEQPKYPRTDNQASLTLIATEFGSRDEAVAGLDAIVATMSKGVSFEVGGEQHTAQINYDTPIEGVGDKAVFSEGGTLLVAYDARQITVAVSTSDDPAIKRQQSIQLAQRLMTGK